MIEYKKSLAILVFNDKGELALQLRAADDDSFPSHWDFSAGGGIGESENEKNAAERELKEELGVSAELEFITKAHYTYSAWKPNTIRETDLFIYKTLHNGPFQPDLKEIEKVDFFSLDQINKMLQSGEKFHPELKLSWERGVIK
jgi:isopentenyldiphosphate isomerase